MTADGSDYIFKRIIYEYVWTLSDLAWGVAAGDHLQYKISGFKDYSMKIFVCFYS